MYSAKQIYERLKKVGYEAKYVSGTNNMVQMESESTTFHAKDDRFILYATEEHFNAIKSSSKLIGISEVVSPSNKDEGRNIVNSFPGEKKVICLNLGNKIINPTSARKYNPHEIVIFTNKAFEIVFEIITGFKFLGDEDIPDYLGILEYLENNWHIPYQQPGKAGLTKEESEHFLQVKRNAQKIVSELKKIGNLCRDRFGLDKLEKITWDDGSHSYTKKYLWVPMKYAKFADCNISISAFVELADKSTARFRISLEIKNEKTESDEWKQYHKHLELPLNESIGMVYVGGTNELDVPQIINESQIEIRENRKFKPSEKVQICRHLTKEQFHSNEEFHAALLETVEALLPYYNHVLGLDNEDGWWPPLNDFDPGISVDDWVKILNDKEIMSQEKLSLLDKMVKLGGSATCTKIAAKFGGEAITYKNCGQDIGRLINHKYGIPFFKDGETNRMFTIPFVGKNITEDGKRRYAWKIREPLMKALSMIDLDEDTIMNQNENYDLNMILYGPPGTGKTYNSATYAVAICDNKKVEELTDYSAVMDRYNELKKEGRIAFTTFHQSYGYEEFIEGIKPVLSDSDDSKKELGYKIEPGVFKQFCINNNKQNVEDDNNVGFIKEEPHIWGMLLGGTGLKDIKKECFDNGEARINFDEVDDSDILDEYGDDEKSSYSAKQMVDYFINSVEIGDIILTEKTNKTIDAIGVVTGDYKFEESRIGKYSRVRAVKWLTTDLDWDITNLLPKGKVQMARKSIFPFDYIGIDAIYEVLEKTGIDDTFSLRKENEPCVFIIDEINRGNISKIFGELITLIEDTKREGQPEAATAILPYSGEEFSVPSNVYILGTMNTADRSIQLMDTALRRRFKFVEKMPDADILRNLGINDVDFGGTTLNIPRMLEAINDRIAYLFDREHTIGHAFFTGLKEDHSIEKLATIFEKSVIPLLQEYFYEDYQKIQLVLGDNAKTDESLKFIKNTPVKLKELFMGNVEDIVDEQEVKYEINHDAFMNIEAYKTIANDL